MTAPRRRKRRIDGSEKTERAHEAVKQHEEGSPKGGRSALETPGFADSEALSHEESQVESGDVEKRALCDVLVTAKMRAAHTAGLQRVGKAPLDELASLPHQTLTAVASDSAPIAVDHIALNLLAAPTLPPAPGLGNVRSKCAAPEAPPCCDSPCRQRLLRCTRSASSFRPRARAHRPNSSRRLPRSSSP